MKSNWLKFIKVYIAMTRRAKYANVIKAYAITASYLENSVYNNKLQSWLLILVIVSLTRK